MKPIAIVFALLLTTSVFAQQTPERTDLSVSPIMISNPCGSEAIILSQGWTQNMFAVHSNGGHTFVNWKYHVHGSGYGTLTGMLYEVNEVAPYNFSGSADGFSYDSIGNFTIKSPTGTSKIKFNFHATFSPSTGLDVKVDKNTVTCR